jgi:hypothetical protein
MENKRRKSWTRLFFFLRQPCPSEKKERGKKTKQHVSLVGFLILLKFTSKLPRAEEMLEGRRKKTMEEKNGNSQLSNDLIWVNKERFFPSLRLYVCACESDETVVRPPPPSHPPPSRHTERRKLSNFSRKRSEK